MSANFESRKRSPPPSPGPFLAEVTNHLDPMYMGRLEIALIKTIPSNVEFQSETYIANYCSPFMGFTSERFEGNNPVDFNDVQKSYGFWMIPPDIGTTVMVIFIGGDPNQCYWFGCIQAPFQNHMVPGIAATDEVLMTPEQARKYQVSILPTAERHKSSLKEGVTPDGKPKPVHPFADRLKDQGLLADKIRGITSSGARREVPSSVFGISTPGPIDTSPGAKKGKIGYKSKQRDGKEAFISRLGGTTFVMDDGDPDGLNELVRIRTRTGHQLLLHNSSDLIYIGNSKGTSWIEMTSNGKIDIYCKDSISIHTENDFNFRADRDINLEAGRNINIRSSGNMETNITGYLYLSVDDHSKIFVRKDLDISGGDGLKLSVENNIEVLTNKSFIASANDGIDIAGESHISIGSGADLNLGANNNILLSGSRIDLNGPSAAAPSIASKADVPPDLPLFTLPNRKKEIGWEGMKFYKDPNPIISIMQRVPTHEPWDQHENINPDKFSPSATDVTLTDRTGSGVPPNPKTTAGGLAGEGQKPANEPEITPGTCSPEFAKQINNPAAQAGIASLKDACKKYGLTSPYAVAALLGIAGGECGWKLVEENFNYSAARLLQVFPSVFKGDQALAQKYAGNPNNSLPEFLYGPESSKGRGLGNSQPGDGGKFIGRGYIQLTGRANYQKYGGMIGQDLVGNPKLLNDSKIAAEVSVKYLLDRCKADQNNSGYFEAACKAVGFNTPDIKAKKKGFYECFYSQLSGSTLSAGQGGIVTDSSGTPIRTGGGSQ